MKLSAVGVLFIFLLFIQHGKCDEIPDQKPSWLQNFIPFELFTRVKNKTININNNIPDQKHSWLQNFMPFEVFTTMKNKTININNNIKDYVSAFARETGRSFKSYVLDRSHKLFDKPMKNHSDAEREEKLKQKFSDYIDDASKSQIRVFDSIAPKKIQHECGKDPSIHMSTPQLIALHGYAAESHTVLTDDGYILTIHRIPYSKNLQDRKVPKKTVLLHHGLLGSSADWVLAGPEKGLAYFLSDAGYDVWLANVRGNTYSKAHVSRSIDSAEFWNFTFHDVSQHDLPAVIDYISEIKSDVKINYIGHSMGTTILFALLSTKPHYNDVLRAGFALAPVAYMSEVRGPITLLARFADDLLYLLKLLGANEFLPQNAVLRWLSKHMCEINHYEEAICENSLFVLCGHDEKQFNRTLLPLILGHVPAGASTKTLVHYAQEIRHDGRFQQFDYGSSGNMQQYGTKKPPEYPLHNITLPIALLSAENDWLAGEGDVRRLYAKLPNPIEHYVVPMKEFNHIDFLWAVDAPKLVYFRLLELLDKEMDSVTDTSVEESNNIVIEW